MRDLLLALAGILVTLPASVIIAVAIKLDSPGAVFFVQERVGENGALFKLYKFRSMYSGGGDESEQARDPVTLKRDPRVTRVGNLIRKLHLDEIPQLINVLKGEMSLVGPRPYHPAQALGELPKVLPQFPLRHVVAPGITGWAQVRCNYGDSIERFRERLACDLYYVKHANFLLDLLIMLETVRVILWRRGSR